MKYEIWYITCYVFASFLSTAVASGRIQRFGMFKKMITPCVLSISFLLTENIGTPASSSAVAAPTVQMETSPRTEDRNIYNIYSPDKIEDRFNQIDSRFGRLETFLFSAVVGGIFYATVVRKEDQAAMARMAAEMASNRKEDQATMASNRKEDQAAMASNRKEDQATVARNDKEAKGLRRIDRFMSVLLIVLTSGLSDNSPVYRLLSLVVSKIFGFFSSNIFLKTFILRIFP